MYGRLSVAALFKPGVFINRTARKEGRPRRAARTLISLEDAGLMTEKTIGFSVTLVIPVLNEAKCINALLDSIASQTHQPGEIIFVDGGSTDGSVDLLREAEVKFDRSGFAGDRLKSAVRRPRLRVIEAGEATPGRGRNIGIAAAANEWIALTDAGIELDSEWLERLIEPAARDESVRVVYGGYEAVIGNFFERCAALAYLAPRRQRPGGLMRGPSIASALIHRDVWTAVGGFPDIRAAEDLFFMERVGKFNFKIGWAPSAIVRWRLRPTLASTFKKFLLYSKHNVWAGRQWDWHYGLARNYLAALPFVALAIAHSRWWLIVPLLASFARVAKNIWERRDGRGVWWLLNPIQFVGAAVVILVIDLASFAGWAQAALQENGSSKAEDQPAAS